MDERFDNAAADEACRVETPDGSGDWYEVYSAYFMGDPLDNCAVKEQVDCLPFPA